MHSLSTPDHDDPDLAETPYHFEGEETPRPPGQEQGRPTALPEAAEGRSPTEEDETPFEGAMPPALDAGHGQTPGERETPQFYDAEDRQPWRPEARGRPGPTATRGPSSSTSTPIRPMPEGECPRPRRRDPTDDAP